MPLKVRRAGYEKVFRKPPFQAWLDAQPRKGLTYSPNIPNRDGTGWHTQDFVMEAAHRGLPLSISTANKWCSGMKPRSLVRDVRAKFKTVQF